LGLGNVLKGITRLSWSEPPQQRLTEHMMQQTIGVATFSPAADHTPVGIEPQRRAHHRARILFGYVLHLQVSQRGFDALLPQAVLVCGRARLVRYGDHFLAVAVPQIVDSSFETPAAFLCLNLFPLRNPHGFRARPQRCWSLPRPLRLPELT